IPMPKKGGEVGAKIAKDEASLARAFDEAAIASQKSFERSFKAQLKKLEKLHADPKAAGKALRAQARKMAATEIRSAARKAASDATKTLRKRLDEEVKEVAARQKQQNKDLFEDATLTEEFSGMATEILNRITGIGGMRLPYDIDISNVGGGGQGGLASPFKKRSFTIEDELIEEALESDIELLGKMLVRSMAPDIEIAKRFGDVEMTSTMKKMEKDWEAVKREGLRLAKKEGKEFNSAKWSKNRDRAFDDIKGMRDRLRGVYALPENPSHWGHRTALVFRHLNYVRLLGGMTLTAIPDMARPLMVHGFSNVYGDSFRPLMKEFSQFKRLTKELRDMGLAVDMLMNSRAQRLADIGDEFGRGTKFERGLASMSETFGTVSVMSPWNTLFKQLSGAVSHGRLIRAMRAEAAGTITEIELGYLRGNYINAGNGHKILKMLDKHGEITPGGMELSNALSWAKSGKEGQEAYTAFQAALGRDIDRTIVTPGQEIPLDMSGPVGKVLFQFKSFAVASAQRMMLGGLQQADRAAVAGLGFSIGLGMLSYAIKTIDAGRELSDDPRQWIMEGIDRSGVTGWFFEAHNTVEKATSGRVGLGQYMGGKPMSRFASRTAFASIMGPSFGTAQTALGVVGGFGRAAKDDDVWTARDTHAVRKLLPYQNLMGLRRALDEVENGINNVIGAK
ncbi:hypothetical protein N9937_02115, partial [bacterium]|nr:hypothetical protein [bacterium]